MSDTDFKLRGEFVQLCDLLKLVGVADSGGHGKTLVAGGQVRVDGITEHRKTAKIRGGQIVECGDVRIRVLSR
jgi:ribosome-associated protein